MTDWADDVADSLCAWNPMSDGTLAWFAHCDVIAAALRKAKADGIREAAEMLVGQKGIDRARLLDVSTAFKSRANQIEKGE